jgi:hypothetical protein
MEDARTSPHHVAHVGGVGVGDDGRERPVVVEEHDDLLPLGRAGNLLELPERRRVLPLLKSARQKVNDLKATTGHAPRKTATRGRETETKNSPSRP